MISDVVVNVFAPEVIYFAYFAIEYTEAFCTLILSIAIDFVLFVCLHIYILSMCLGVVVSAHIQPASARGIGIQVIHKWSQMPRKRPLLVQK